jgi:hypothetical protein
MIAHVFDKYKQADDAVDFLVNLIDEIGLLNAQTLMLRSIRFKHFVIY